MNRHVKRAEAIAAAIQHAFEQDRAELGQVVLPLVTPPVVPVEPSVSLPFVPPPPPSAPAPVTSLEDFLKPLTPDNGTAGGAPVPA